MECSDCNSEKVRRKVSFDSKTVNKRGGGTMEVETSTQVFECLDCGATQ